MRCGWRYCERMKRVTVPFVTATYFYQQKVGNGADAV